MPNGHPSKHGKEHVSTQYIGKNGNIRVSVAVTRFIVRLVHGSDDRQQRITLTRADAIVLRDSLTTAIGRVGDFPEADL